MKVLDLQCLHGHAFEGWFASHAAFEEQRAQGLVSCPLCGAAEVHKKPSAPRLNLGRNPTPATDPAQQMAAAWMAFSRQLAQHSTDVGEAFAEQARRMHYGETPERAIRGRTSVEEAQALLEEGIGVLPLLLPQGSGETLQ